MNALDVRSVEIPACDDHGGYASARVSLIWECPTCGGPRGAVQRVVSFDGSRRLGCDGWSNQCGHVDTYAAVRREAGSAWRVNWDEIGAAWLEGLDRS